MGRRGGRRRFGQAEAGRPRGPHHAPDGNHYTSFVRKGRLSANPAGSGAPRRGGVPSINWAAWEDVKARAEPSDGSSACCRYLLVYDGVGGVF